MDSDEQKDNACLWKMPFYEARTEEWIPTEVQNAPT